LSFRPSNEIIQGSELGQRGFDEYAVFKNAGAAGKVAAGLSREAIGILTVRA
jgi:hypothetical protein